MGIIVECSCGKRLNKEETEYVRNNPCSLFNCSINKWDRKKRRKQKRRDWKHWRSMKEWERKNRIKKEN